MCALQDLREHLPLARKHLGVLYTQPIDKGPIWLIVQHGNKTFGVEAIVWSTEEECSRDHVEEVKEAIFEARLGDSNQCLFDQQPAEAVTNGREGLSLVRSQYLTNSNLERAI